MGTPSSVKLTVPARVPRTDPLDTKAKYATGQSTWTARDGKDRMDRAVGAGLTTKRSIAPT